MSEFHTVKLVPFPVKFAVYAACDQTIVYLAAGSAWTTSHAESLLFETKKEAEEAVRRMSAAEGRELTLVEDDLDDYVYDEVVAGKDPDKIVLLHTVRDEAEFRTRKDTW